MLIESWQQSPHIDARWRRASTKPTARTNASTQTHRAQLSLGSALRSYPNYVRFTHHSTPDASEASSISTLNPRQLLLVSRLLNMTKAATHAKPAVAPRPCKTVT